MSRRSRFAGATLLALAAASLLTGLGAAGAAASTITTASTLTQPQVTIAPVTTTTPASALPGRNRPVIVVGDMNTPEQFVLGALYQVALQHAGYTVVATRNIGTPFIAQLSLKQGTLDLYPDYLDSNLLPSWDRTVADLKQNFMTAGKAYFAGARYAQQHGFELLRPTPGSDTLSLAVTSAFARENHVTSMAQLAQLAPLTFGMPLGFGGLWRAEQAYKFKAGVVEYGATGAEYDSLDTGSVQVTYADSTDPQLSEPRYVLLADPKHVYGFGNIVPVTTPEVVRLEGPAFVRIINRIDALLTTRVLRGLNAEVQPTDQDQTAVAQQFLEGNGLLPPVKYQAAGSG